MGDTVTGLIPDRRAPGQSRDQPGAPRASHGGKSLLAAGWEHSTPACLAPTNKSLAQSNKSWDGISATKRA